jgi:hypothetical protein
MRLATRSHNGRNMRLRSRFAREPGGTSPVAAANHRRGGGRKRVVAPDGGELAPSSEQEPDGTLLKALARAWRWQRMLDEGVYTSVSEIGDAEGISKSYVSRILRLALLAPDIGGDPSG